MPHATATAAPPDEPPQVVGVARGAEHLVESLRAGAELGRVGLADQDRARRLQALGHDVVLGRHVVLVDERAPGGAHALRRDDVLDGDGQAAEGQVFRPFSVECFRLLQRLIGQEGHDRVDLRVHALDLRDERAYHLGGRKLARPDQARKRSRRGKTDLGAQQPPPRVGGKCYISTMSNCSWE
jgi:hypothetical protein